MAIDPRIPLMGAQIAQAPLQLPDPLEQAARVMQFREMMARRELREKQLQAQQLKFEEALRKQQQLRDVQALYTQGGPAPAAPRTPQFTDADRVLMAGYPSNLIAPLYNPPPEEGVAAPQPLPTLQKLIATGGPETGLELFGKQTDIAKKEAEAEEVRRKAEAAKVQARANIAYGILQGNSPQAFTAGILRASGQDLIDADTTRALLAEGYTDNMRQTLRAMVSNAMTPQVQMQEGRAETLLGAQLPGERAESERKQELAAQAKVATLQQRRAEAGFKLAAAAARGPEAFQAALAQVEDPEIRDYFADAQTSYEVMRRIQSPQEYVQSTQGEYGKIRKYPQPVMDQRIAEAAAGAGARANTLLTPAKIDQEVERARRIAQATSQSRGAGNLQVYKRKKNDLLNLESAVKAYKRELDSVGPTFQPGKGARLKALFTALQMQLKGEGMFSLGVLTGPDLTVLGGAISDPTGVQGNWLGTKALDEQLDVLMNAIKTHNKNLDVTYQGNQGEEDLSGLTDAEIRERMNNAQ